MYLVMYVKRKAQRLLVSIAVVVAPSLLCAQIVYVDTALGIFNPKLIYGRIDLDNCSDSLLGDHGAYSSAFDMAIRPDTIVYGYGITNFPGDTIFFTGVPNSSTTTFFPDFDDYDPGIVGLTCDENGFGYGAGLGITQFDLIWPGFQATYLGDLPPDMRCQGDITYREGKFYVAAVGNKLVEVNMKDPSKSQIVMEFPPSTLPVHGLATVQSGCDSVATYAIGRAVDHSEVYEIDFDDWTATLVCDMPELAVTGAGSFTECMLPPCGVFIDLDVDNSSFGFLGNYCADTFCHPSLAVADTDVVILSGVGYLDSVTFELVDVLDQGNEYLYTTPTSNIIVTGENTTYLTLVGNGATIDNFEAALKAVVYENSSMAASSGKRQVLVTGWADGEASPVSVAELPFFKELLQIMVAPVAPTCHGFSDGGITLNPQGGTAPYDYIWEIPQQGSFVDSLPSGTYPFAVIDSLGCTKLDTVLLDDPPLLTVDIANIGPATTCDDSAQLMGIGTGGSGMLSYQWNNGITDSLNSDLEAGSYTLTVSDTNSCNATASYQVLAGDSVFVMQSLTACEGDGVVWNGELYTTDTLVCQSFTLPNGCDSTTCLSLTALPSPNVSISADGNFCETGEITLSAGTHPDYLWSTNEISSSINVSDAGGYSVTVANAEGCTSTASIYLDPPVTTDISFESPSCYEVDDGWIVFENTSGGVPPYQYSIDGGVQFFGDGEFDGLPAGGYTAIVGDAEGCQTETSVTLLSPAPITIEAGVDMEIGLGGDIVLAASTNLFNPIVSWHPPDYLSCPTCLETVAAPPVTTQYEVEMTDSNGCAATDTVTITVTDRSNIYVPTVFSPNGDGVNDFFTIYAGAAFTEIRYLKIFDRWGSMVFSRTSFAPNVEGDGWDGTLKGTPVQSGVYPFTTEVGKADGGVKVVSGEVVLVR